LCTKPAAEDDTKQTKANYKTDTFATREILLNELPDKFRKIQAGIPPMRLRSIDHGANRETAILEALGLLREAHGRESHIVAIVEARMNEIRKKNLQSSTQVLIDVLMCPSGSSYYCDESQTMNILRPYLTAVRKGLNCI
jgi:hypothetical protein